MDTVPNTFPELFWGFTIVWVILGAYIFSLHRRLRKLEQNRFSDK